MAKELLLEIGVEEMPAHVVRPSVEQLADKMAKFLTDARLTFSSIKTYATPRRLTIAVSEIADKQPDLSEEVKGPAKKIALAENGDWSKAAQGFVRGQGLTTDDITFKEIKGVEYVYVDKFVSGKPAEEVLTDLHTVIENMTFPVNMHWGSYHFKFIRPIRWLVALLDNEILPLQILNVTSDRISRGHRFLGEDIAIEHPSEYVEKLQHEFVIADLDERKQMIIDQVNEMAAKNNWQVDLDEKLLEEVTNLVEYPTAFVGSFSEKYLNVPEEVLVTSMKEHQRYFDVRDKNGKLLPYFVAVRNGDAAHIDTVIKGNEKVLLARLDDAEFFYQEDQKTSIEDYVNKLKHVTFHEKIGSMYEKMQRVGIIAQILGKNIGLSAEEMTDLLRASEIYKFDLVTGMVDEFPELQGIMGEKYALLKGEKPAVATAIREHYLPISSEGALPETTLGSILAIADKLDSVISFIGVGMLPTGSSDPYALRRQAYGLMRIVEARRWAFPMISLRLEIDQLLAENQLLPKQIAEADAQFIDFMKARIKQLLSSEDVRHDVIEAVLNGHQENAAVMLETANVLMHHLVDKHFKTTVEALTRVIHLAEKGQELLANADQLTVLPDLFETDSEKALYAAIQDLQARFSENSLEENFQAFDSLRPLIEKFFDENMVMVDDEKVRNNRLIMLMQLAKLVLDFASLDHLVVK